MKATNEYVELIQKLNLKIDDVEKMIKLLLINNLIDDVQNVYKSDVEANLKEESVNNSFDDIKNTYKSAIETDSEIKNIVSSNKMKLGKQEQINGINTISINIPLKINVSITGIRQVKNLIKTKYNHIEPVFRYEKINATQRKYVLQEKVSFSVRDKAIHIFEPCNEKRNLNSHFIDFI